MRTSHRKYNAPSLGWTQGSHLPAMGLAMLWSVPTLRHLYTSRSHPVDCMWLLAGSDASNCHLQIFYHKLARYPRCNEDSECGLHVQWLSPRRHTDTDIPNRYRFHFDFALGKLWFIVCVICHPFLLILLCLTHSEHSLKDRAARCYMFVRGNVRSCDQCGRRRRAGHWFGCGCPVR